jgi:hypothetical protein
VDREAGTTGDDAQVGAAMAGEDVVHHAVPAAALPYWRAGMMCNRNVLPLSSYPVY